MEAVLERLELADVQTPDPKETAFSDPAYFRYKDRFYRAQLQVFR
jgi:hypothetical protein